MWKCRYARESFDPRPLALRNLGRVPLSAVWGALLMVGACVLGALIGSFFALSWAALGLIPEGAAHVPGTSACPYGIPMAGYPGRSGGLGRKAGADERRIECDRGRIPRRNGKGERT